MKKLLLLLIATTFVACKSDLDKKIAAFEYSGTIEKIKKDNTEYSDADFKQASKELDKYVFQALAQEKKELDVTYRQLLDEAKEHNTKKAKELDDYQNSLKPLYEAIDVFIDDAKYMYDSDFAVGIYSDFYVYTINIKNKSDKAVVAIKGKFYLYNEKEEVLTKIVIDKTGEVPAGKEAELKDYSIIQDDDNLSELKVLPLDKIKVVWEPEQIIFEGGDRISAGKKPFDLDDF